LAAKIHVLPLPAAKVHIPQIPDAFDEINLLGEPIPNYDAWWCGFWFRERPH
jgi:hypothetical protein